MLCYIVACYVAYIASSEEFGTLHVVDYEIRPQAILPTSSRLIGIFTKYLGAALGMALQAWRSHTLSLRKKSMFVDQTEAPAKLE